MADLSLKHIYKVYPNGTKAVNDFNMQIADKEFIVFVGPSGCGKSTVLRMIAGLEPITAGELKIGDVVVNELEPKDRDIAMVFQNYALYPHMTIYENIAFGLRMRRIPDIKKDKDGNIVRDKNGEPIKVMRKYNKAELDAKVNEAAEVLGITDYLKRKPKEMSGGQRQRVALGRAIVREPKVMLLDEPLSNLDAKLRTQMRSEIVKLHKKLNTTFIYVTHDQVEAMTMGTRIVVMKAGYIQQIDTPKNLYKYPGNKFVAGFIGTPQMNFFEGTLKKVGDEVIIDFANSDAKITVPYSMMMKTMPLYLNGDKTVIIGLRAEDVSLDPEKVEKSTAKIKVKISHTEELGTETLVYGDIDMNGNGFDDTGTRIIIKAGGFKDYKTDDILEAALDITAIHLFDKETEESILPRIPQYNFLDCVSKDGKLQFCNVEIVIPPAISLSDGNYHLLVPPAAITLEGNISAEVVGCEEINGQVLVSLDIGGRRLFALTDKSVENGKTTIKVDLKSIALYKDGENVVSPMPMLNTMNGTFAMVKNGKVRSYYAVIGGKQLAVPEQIYLKMFAALSGRKVYNTSFDYEWSPYDIAISNDGIEGEVVEVLDYGTEQFAKVNAAGSTLYIKTDKPVSGKVHISPDVSAVGVVEKTRGIKIV
ncbi:MAG TPA: ATP-binding cassette domain-containing protein [Candidatus Coproplasma stercoravium]|nr:ATP-binding cassette domain-containing protein [Candidatus Coproplasma stercoravium]